MKVLVTGGAGFIGNHLCRHLLEYGHYVTCVDDLYTGKIENIIDLNRNRKFKFIEVDITSDRFTYIMASIGPIDHIYHLACPASPIHYQKDPMRTIKTCINGTINVLNYARTINAKVLLSSTSEIYGDPLEHPQKETYRGNVNTLGTRACYDESKRLAETIIMEYHRCYGLSVRIARIFNTYGPGMSVKDGRIVSNFVHQCLTGKDITIYGDGNQTRSLCYISDMVDGLECIMDADEIGPFNVGNPGEFSINQIAGIVKHLTKSKSSIVYLPLPEDDPKKRCPDISKINEIGWMPSIDLEKGLCLTIKAAQRSLG